MIKQQIDELLAPELTKVEGHLKSEQKVFETLEE